MPPYYPLLLLLIGGSTSPLGAQPPGTDDCYLPPITISKGLGLGGAHTRWPEGIVPYSFDLPDNTAGKNIRGVMQEAVTHMNENTNVCWVPALSQGEGVRIVLSDQEYNYASLGYSPFGANTIAMLSQSVGVGLHEMGHVLGLHHEQKRWDRDEHILVYEENIDPRFLGEFAKVDTVPTEQWTAVTAYDRGSIMHYQPYAFSSNGKPTLTDLAGNTEGIGFQSTLSPYDIDQINAMYPGGPSRSACDSLVRQRSTSVTLSVAGSDGLDAPCRNRETVLLATATGPASENLRYSWAAASGSPSTGQGPEFRVRFTTFGRHTVTLWVYRDRELFQQQEHTIEVPYDEDVLTIIGNPAARSQGVHFRLSTQYENYRVQLIDASGRTVYAKDFQTAPCVVEGVIPTTDLSAGVYHLMYLRGRETFGQRVIIH